MKNEKVDTTSSSEEITDVTDVSSSERSKGINERVLILVVEYPPELAGKEFEINSPGILGRLSSTSIHIPENSVSRKHLFFDPDHKNQRVYIRDLNSTNGTYINGKKITATYIGPGDKILVGRVALRLEARTLTEHNIRKRLSKDAEIDSLTGILNRRALEAEITRLINSQTKFCLVFIDLDGFKKVNDTYGHKKGDSILRICGEVIKRNIRESDIAGRYGGDEIILILKNVDSNIAGKIIDRIRTNFIIESKSKEGINIDFSYGVAEFPKDGLNFSQILEIADHRLYKIKGKKYPNLAYLG